MTRRDYWLGVLAISAAIVLHALLPRYEWRSLAGTNQFLRIDRWTGAAIGGGVVNIAGRPWGVWTPADDIRVAREAAEIERQAAVRREQEENQRRSRRDIDAVIEEADRALAQPVEGTRPKR